MNRRELIFKLGLKGKIIATVDTDPAMIPRSGEIVGINRTDYMVTQVVWQYNISNLPSKTVMMKDLRVFIILEKINYE